MAMLKKEVFQKYGIEFKSDKILAPDGVWISLFLKQGNTKLGNNVWTFSLPAGTSGTCICNCKGCYAKTGRYIFRNVAESLRRNQYYVEEFPDFFRRALQAQIATLPKGSEIRIHAAGDFHTRNEEVYAGIWAETVGKFTHDTFWTYTKISRFENLFDAFPNGNVVKSVIPGCGINYGTCEYVLKVREALIAMGKTPHICKCGIDHAFHCEGCGQCSSNEFVLFLEHSTGYNAEKDPLYPEILRIIEEQDKAMSMRHTA